MVLNLYASIKDLPIVSLDSHVNPSFIPEPFLS